MNNFTTALDGADDYARALMACGWPAEDVAAALVVEGLALSNATAGRAATADMLRGLARHLEAT